MKTILIDSGTTNSRLRLVNGNESKVIDQLKINVGVRNTAIDGHNEQLKKSLKQALEEILEKNSLTAKDISYLVASGMITSDLGVHEVPHITSPAGFGDFAQNSLVIELEEFLLIPCIFVPGMKNNTLNFSNPLESINEFDVMRGEEVETIGLLKQIDVEGNGIMVLPGSHTKYVAVDGQKNLQACLSTLGGEILHAIQKETILSKSLSPELVETIDVEMLEKGYEASKKHGFTRSFYHIRLLQMFSELDDNQRANYFVGAVICDDIQALMQTTEHNQVDWVIVGGSDPLRKAFVHLLKYLGNGWRIIEASDQQVAASMVFGAQEVASIYLADNQLNVSDY
ncbi:2-dehydro-3-deoxygalactonokinase [Planococcus sp. 4-30]|uniref:2-dehydro-3-deoxygalactonokinase n=1 Tax=Planococcus sp. 4-30 TaxID=2874583 RepID=UPI001CBF963C|nr:2-dehydro-3-deoxygalactonokinase [Planococcus sp. 4-30]